ncbi:tryptophan halogenase family protein [Catenovulum agarivorans]|nr:tryptophan halogenase family protein [Catenovulum agarivorans]
MQLKNQKILIVGGGTSGWMAASLLAKKWPNCQIKLIESQNIGTVGVGEGSTPYIKQFFNALEIEESDWMPFCNATYKNGIEFINWSTQPGYNRYFHAFLSDLDEQHTPLFEQATLNRRQGQAVKAHPDGYFFLQTLAQQHRQPTLEVQSNNNAAPHNIYAYHFDSGKLAEYLKQYCLNLGVEHQFVDIETVELAGNGEIAAVIAKDKCRFEADLYLDCTGFSSLLIEKTLKERFISFDENLYNDRAVTVASKAQMHYQPQTTSTALTNGWAWQIPLTSRTGNGYVYSSKYISDEQATQELIEFVGRDNLIGEPRVIPMKVGRVERAWVKNCVAIGLSQGFIEPLEATGLHFIQTSIESFILLYELGEGSAEYRQVYNREIEHVFERVRDYIVSHYLTNSRNDTEYWRVCRDKINISDTLDGLMRQWCSGKDFKAALKKAELDHIYPSASWHMLLAGMGFLPPIDGAHRLSDSEKRTLAQIAEVHQQHINVYGKT